MGVEPFVDLVIPVHDISRPIRRAVASAIDGVERGTLRVTVVCHNIDTAGIVEALDGLDPAALRVVEYRDDVRSPAGPFNHGISLATAPYVAVMGSDDFLERGAISAWMRRVTELGSSAALVRLRYQGGAKLHNPLPRLCRSTRLDPVRDRLYYRTSPLGLLSRSAVERLGPLFAEHAPVGGDLNFSSRFWSSGERIDYLRNDPCYVIGSDAISRITTQPRPMREPMAALRDLVRRDWIGQLTTAQRRALAIKVTRIHIIGALSGRPHASDWGSSDLADVREALDDVLGLAEGVLAPFAIADRRLLDAALDPSTDVESLIRAIAAHANAARLSRLMTRNPWLSFHRESTLVRFILYKFTR